MVTLEGLDRRVTALEDSVKRIDDRLKRIDDRLDNIVQILDLIVKMLQDHEAKMETTELVHKKDFDILVNLIEGLQSNSKM